MSTRPSILERGPRDAVSLEAREDGVLFKPAGMSVEVTRSSDDPPQFETLLDWLRSELARRGASGVALVPRLPHRLDRMACGIVVVALSDRAAAFHSRQIAEGRWEKYYIARVRGESETLDGLRGRHRLYLKREGRRAKVVRSGGDRAELEVLAAADAPTHAGESHVLIRLLTGRYHQIRVTLEHLGAPVAGDPLYDQSDAAMLVTTPPFLCHALLRLPALDGQCDVLSLTPAQLPERIDESLRNALNRCGQHPAT